MLKVSLHTEDYYVVIKNDNLNFAYIFYLNIDLVPWCNIFYLDITSLPYVM